MCCVGPRKQNTGLVSLLSWHRMHYPFPLGNGCLGTVTCTNLPTLKIWGICVLVLLLREVCPSEKFHTVPHNEANTCVQMDDTSAQETTAS